MTLYCSTCCHCCCASGHKLPESFTATTDLAAVVSSCEVVLMVVPTPFVARTLAPVADRFRPDGILVSCTKGILNDTLETRKGTELQGITCQSIQSISHAVSQAVG